MYIPTTHPSQNPNNTRRLPRGQGRGQGHPPFLLRTGRCACHGAVALGVSWISLVGNILLIYG